MVYLSLIIVSNEYFVNYVRWQIEKVAKLLGTSQRDIIKHLTRVKTSQSDETVEMEATLKEFETHRDELAMVLV